jgi:hypothetical protein
VEMKNLAEEIISLAGEMKNLAEKIISMPGK